MYEDISDDIYEHLGQRLRALRTEKRLTQSHVARIIDVSPQQYQKYEDARSKCSLNNILRLADYFAVSIDEFLPSPGAEPAREPQTQSPAEPPPAPDGGPGVEADLLARLVSAYVRLTTLDEKLRLVQLVEAIVAREEKVQDV